MREGVSSFQGGIVPVFLLFQIKATSVFTRRSSRQALLPVRGGSIGVINVGVTEMFSGKAQNVDPLCAALEISIRQNHTLPLVDEGLTSLTFAKGVPRM